MQRLPPHDLRPPISVTGLVQSLGMRVICIGLSLTTLAWVTACAPIESRQTSATSTLSTNHDAIIPGLRDAYLSPEYWIERLDAPNEVTLPADAIQARNQALLERDPSMFDLQLLPRTLTAEAVRTRIQRVSVIPQSPRYTSQGHLLDEPQKSALLSTLALDAIPAKVTPKFGLITQRADLRAFPTDQRVFSRPDEWDIDRFQESALFPGTPVALLHTSADAHWGFIVSTTYSAWVSLDKLALGSRDTVLNYGQTSPYLVVTGSKAHTVYTPENPKVSQVVLDMGVRVPIWQEWPIAQPVNGQLAYASHVIALPIRNEHGQLDIAPALVPRSEDVATHFLPLTRANLIRQAFKFLGERYGWGHSYGTRDCSGFVAEIYRSVGLTLPRNTRDQGMSEVFERLELGETHTHEQRLRLLQQLDVGDLLYIPGHVMMVIGKVEDDIWLIHDTTGIRYQKASGERVTVPLNQVAVTPLLPLLDESGKPLIDSIYSVQRIGQGRLQ